MTSRRDLKRAAYTWVSDEPSLWTKKASSTRAMAQEMQHTETRECMLKIAFLYDEMAKCVQMRLMGVTCDHDTEAPTLPPERRRK